MTTLHSPLYPTGAEHAAATPELHEQPAPLMLEYHGETDQDLFYIPKVTGVFAASALAIGILVNLGVLMVFHKGAPEKMVQEMFVQIAYVFGITGVGASLLLVGLKFRDDHASRVLIPKHWLATMGTGAVFSLVVWSLWLYVNNSKVFQVNVFAQAVVWMCIIALPCVACFWLVRPKQDFGH